jgi:hypothetical protein
MKGAIAGGFVQQHPVGDQPNGIRDADASRFCQEIDQPGMEQWLTSQ